MNAKTVFAFIAGAAIGSIATWKLMKNKYEDIAQEEINSIMREIEARKDTAEPAEPEQEQAPWRVDKPNLSEYAAILRDARYEIEKNEKEGGDESVNSNKKPYVIPPEEFDELDDYYIASLTYYEDGVMTDEMGTPMSAKAIEETVGTDAVTHFGEYEDDSVFVRNEELKTDYEILRDNKKYSEIDSDPHRDDD